ncbi:MAG: cytochrome c maturation protein CcmE [Anaerolineae bacterium]
MAKSNVISEVKTGGSLMPKSKFIVGGAIILLVIGYLTFTSFKSSTVYYYTVGELKAKGSDVYGEEVRVSGQLVKDSIEWDAKGLILRFTITDGAQELPVVYQGPIPDTFGKGTEIVIEGTYTPFGVFEAHTLLVKCPSKYEVAEAE